MKVSICIPAYKHIDVLERCIRSIFEQDFPDYEIIITDDSPDDVIEKKIQIYSDSRIRYFKNSQTLGSPQNWNECIKKAEGDYIKILHHDDWFSSSQSLKKFVLLLDENPEVDIAFSNCTNVSNSQKINHTIKDSYLVKIKGEPERLFLGNRIGAPSVCIFRNHKNYVFDPNLTWLVDVDFYIGILQQNNQCVHISEPLINIGISASQVTQQCMAKPEIRIHEGIYLYDKLQLNKKKFYYRHSLLKRMGREKIFHTIQLRKLLPENTNFSFSYIDSLWAQYYYVKKRTREMIIFYLTPKYNV